MPDATDDSTSMSRSRLPTIAGATATGNAITRTKKYNDIIINAIDIAIAMIVIGIAKCPGREFIGIRVCQHQIEYEQDQ